MPFERPEQAIVHFPRPYLLYFDGDCHLCARFAQYIDKLDHDRQVHCQPYQTADHLPFGLTRDVLSTDLHLLAADGRVYTGPRATEQLARVLPGIRRYRWMIENKIGRKIHHRIFRWASKMRRPGCRSCM